MGLQTETRDIRGLTVRCTQLPARRAYALVPKLGAIMAPALAELETSQIKDLGAVDLSAVGPAFQRFFQALEDADADKLMMQLLSSTSVIKDGDLFDLTSGAKIDQAFEGNLPALFQTLWFSVELNFADFIGAVSEMTPPEAAVKASPSG
jgi:hypothetical protein